MSVPVQVVPDPPLVLPFFGPAPMLIQADDTRIEITVPGGTCVRVGACGSLVVLRRIMAAGRWPSAT